MCRLPAATPSLLCRSISLVTGERYPEITWKGREVSVDGRQPVEQIEQLRIDLVDIAGAEIPQKIIHRCQRVRQVRASAEVLDREPLAGMRVREAQRAEPTRLPQAVGVVR